MFCTYLKSLVSVQVSRMSAQYIDNLFKLPIVSEV